MKEYIDLDQYEPETEDVLIRSERGEPGTQGYKPPIYMRVRGFSTDDTMHLVKIHGPSLALLYQQATTNGEDMDSTAKMVRMVYEHCPEVLTDVIALASGAEGETFLAAVEKARRLPVSVQFTIVEKVATLTFVGDNAVGEFIETVVRMLGGLDGLMQNVKTSVVGSVASKKRRAS